jgi:hypothetical protein
MIGERGVSCVAEAISAMFLAWNATDAVGARRDAERALAPNVEFVDPDNDIRGIDAFLAMVARFRVANPDAKPGTVGGIDGHHDLARYRWAVELADRTRLTGTDVVRVDERCRIVRIESFIDRVPARGG